MFGTQSQTQNEFKIKRLFLSNVKSQCLSTQFFKDKSTEVFWFMYFGLF